MTNESKISFDEWKSRYTDNPIKYGNEAWNRINSHPLDNLLDLFAQILIGSSPSEKLNIEKLYGKDSSFTWELVIYLRRMGMRLTAVNYFEMFNRANAIVDLVSQFDDFRDIITSLMLLNIGARKIGIDVTEVLNKVDPNILLNKDSLFARALDHDEEIDRIVVRMFGPPEWRSLYQ